MKTRSISGKAVAIIPSAGQGKRMGAAKKNYLSLAGRPVLYHTIKAFEDSDLVDAVILVVPETDEEYCLKNIVEPYGFKKVLMILPGGKERQDSVNNALKMLKDRWKVIVVHDGARPLVTGELIENTIMEAMNSGSAVSAVPVKDTVKEASRGFVKKTLPREALWAVQTPQAFRFNLLMKAHREAFKEGFFGTDESSLVERLGEKVRIVEGSYENIKITTEEDLAFAECILRRRGKTA